MYTYIVGSRLRVACMFRSFGLPHLRRRWLRNMIFRLLRVVLASIDLVPKALSFIFFYLFSPADHEPLLLSPVRPLPLQLLLVLRLRLKLKQHLPRTPSLGPLRTTTTPAPTSTSTAKLQPPTC